MALHILRDLILGLCVRRMLILGVSQGLGLVQGLALVSLLVVVLLSCSLVAVSLFRLRCSRTLSFDFRTTTRA